MKLSEKDYLKLTITVIALGAIVRFVLAALSHPAGDACLHLSAARFIAENGSIPFLQPFGDGREVFWSPPLFHFVTAAVYDFFNLFSTSAAEFAMKFVSPLFGALTLPFVFLITKKLLKNSRAALLATIFVAFIPLHINASVVSFVDAFTTFLTTVAIYLALEKRFLLAGILAGLSLSSKQNALFILPVLFLAIYLNYRKDFNKLTKTSAITALAVFAFGVPWFIRNYILLGNPFWPFLYKIIGGTIAPKAVESNFSLLYILNPTHISQFYLELFGVPSGRIASFDFVSGIIPFLELFLAVWFMITLLFFIPILFGFFVKLNNKVRLFLFAWLLSFFIMLLLYIMNLNMTFARLTLPAIPALAIFWALGFDTIIKKFGNFKIIAFKSSAVIVLILIAAALTFTSAETAKTIVAANAWDVYQDDFDEIKQNTPENALIGYRGQCLSYNINRHVNYDLDEVDFVWVNQNFQLEPISIVPQITIQKIEQDFSIAYENEKTGTKVYERK
jgi:4-amino-4-deoxy-L-arabinose transferase-like glycosyltransferase